jgi:prepilin-type N-terminal cleavage/methylation domain-containing protein
VKAAPQHRSGSPARRGFTLLETLLTIGLMSMIAAVLIGGSSTLLKSTVQSDPEDALRTLLQTIRRNAVQKSKILELTPTDSPDEDGPDFTWGEENAAEDQPRAGEKLPKAEGVKVKILAPESTGAILLGGVASEKALARMRFYPDGTCDRVRLEVTRESGRRIVPIDPLTCAPLPAADAR